MRNKGSFGLGGDTWSGQYVELPENTDWANFQIVIFYVNTQASILGGQQSRYPMDGTVLIDSIGLGSDLVPYKYDQGTSMAAPAVSGAAAVLALLLGVCLRTLTAALQSRDALGRNICVGIFAALFLQTVINLGMNLQVLPVIGVTLPFFSAGGSSVVMMYFCVGLVLSVGLQARRSRVDAVAIL